MSFFWMPHLTPIDPYSLIFSKGGELYRWIFDVDLIWIFQVDKMVCNEPSQRITAPAAAEAAQLTSQKKQVGW